MEEDKYICGVCKANTDRITLTNCKTVIVACSHRAPKLMQYEGFLQFERIDLKAVKAAIQYSKLKQQQQPSALDFNIEVIIEGKG